MAGKSYLQWLGSSTKTQWWCDSGDPREIDLALEHGAVGITTNPPLCAAAMRAWPVEWEAAVKFILTAEKSPAAKAEALVRHVVMEGARKLVPIFQSSMGMLGHICGQVDPAKAGDRDAMLEMGHRFAAWAPNVSVKLPATSSGIDILEELAADGIPVTGTVSFTLSQLLAVAEAHAAGSKRAVAAGLKPAPCNAVLMIGRLDDYLQEVAADNRATASPDDIRQAGLAIAKRCYGIFQERKYTAKLCVAALRGTYHATDMAGADIVLSIHPKYQKALMSSDVPKEEVYSRSVPPDVLERLLGIREFRRAYEPDGLRSEEFVAFGVTQRTLSQFTETGWKLLEGLSR
ncbi:MAG: transaldolase family protein [Rectinemataceae bacterium]